MANSCNKALSGDILNDCAEAIGRGFKNKAWILPYSAMTATRNGNIVSAFTLADNVVAHTIEVPGAAAYTGSTISGEDSDIMMTYTKVVRLWLGARSPENSAHVKELCDAPHVVVLELKNQDADAQQAFVVVGLEQGAYGKAPSQDAYGDAFGGWNVDMTEANAQTPDVFFWSGETVETTRAALNSLLGD